MASGTQFVKICNVDKTIGNIMTLSDIYGTDSYYIDKITDDTNFYIDENGNTVIVFDEYEVAPGYMGTIEFMVK